MYSDNGHTGVNYPASLIAGQMLQPLQWWRNPRYLSLGRPFKNGEAEKLVVTEALTFGLGVVCGSDGFKEVTQRQNHHIN